jgi:hypothetical protein
MGILDDTLHDAARPLPRLDLRRMPDEMQTEFDREPAEDSGGALTVYRLQKDGGKLAPAAPSAPRALDAGSQTAGLFHAPVGYSNDASLQSVISIEGLETGKEQVSTWNSDATDKHELPVSPDSSHRLHYGVSTGSPVSSSRVPSPSDDPGKLVYRIESSDGMRRETGRGATSGGLPFVGEQAELPAALPAIPAAAPRAPAARHKDITAAVPRELNLGGRSGTSDAHAIPVVPTAGAAPSGARALSPAAVAPARREAAGARAQPVAAAPAAPRLSIGRIEVTVVSAPQAPARPAAAPTEAFLSKNYLRRL